MNLAGIYETIAHFTHAGGHIKPGSPIELTHDEAVEALAQGTVVDPVKAEAEARIADRGLPISSADMADAIAEIGRRGDKMNALRVENAKLAEACDMAQKDLADAKAKIDSLDDENAKLRADLDAATKPVAPTADQADTTPAPTKSQKPPKAVMA